MSDNEHQYLIPETANADSIKAHLAARYRFREEPGRTQRRVYYDSFDWRLYQAGALREGGEVNGSARLLLRGRDSGSLEADQTLEGRPRFAWDLPDGPLARRYRRELGFRWYDPAGGVACEPLTGKRADSTVMFSRHLESAWKASYVTPLRTFTDEMATIDQWARTNAMERRSVHRKR